MNKLLSLLAFSLLFTATTWAQALPTSTGYAGRYVGIAVPAKAICATERLIVELEVDAAYGLTLGVFNYDLGPSLQEFSSGWPFFTKKTFKTTIVPSLQSGARGTFTTTGTVSGTLDLRPDGGCLYTFKAYRRFKYN
jgi:hypothetical protein